MVSLFPVPWSRPAARSHSHVGMQLRVRVRVAACVAASPRRRLGLLRRLRHARFFFLVAPLLCSSLVAWTWLAAYWDELYRNGPGEPLMEGGPAAEPSQGPPALRGALLWLPVRSWAQAAACSRPQPPTAAHSTLSRLPASPRRPEAFACAFACACACA